MSCWRILNKKEMKRSETMLTKKVKACWSEGTQLDPADYSDLQNFSNFLHPSFPGAHNFYGDKSFLSIWLDFGGFKLWIQNVFTTGRLNYSQKSAWILVFRENSKSYWHAQRILSPSPIVDHPEADNNRLKSSLLALICILAANYANEGIETFNFAETSPVSQKQNCCGQFNFE